MHKVFISYHHQNDQAYKEALVECGESNSIFIDRSVDTGDILDTLSDQDIRERIRDNYLQDSTVTILLVGKETKGRKHIDWEIYSSMIDGRINKKSGILVVNLPSTNCNRIFAAHGIKEERFVHPEVTNWCSMSRSELEAGFPYMPDRIIDNLVSGAKISVVPWSKLTVEKLDFLIQVAFQDRTDCQYDFTSPMRRRNA